MRTANLALWGIGGLILGAMGVDLFARSIEGLMPGAVITIPQYVLLVFTTGACIVASVGFFIRFFLVAFRKV
jgi:hypothetical protein